jgi:hypothetical protein
MQYFTVTPCASVTLVHVPVLPGQEPSALHHGVHVPAGGLPRQPSCGAHSIMALLGLHDEPAASEPAPVQT